MAETTTTPQSGTQTEEKTPGNIVSRGDVTPVTFAPPVEKTDVDDKGAGTGAAADPNETPEAKTAREAQELLLKNETPEQKTARELAEKNKPPELTDEQFKELLKGKGIELDDKGIEGLKEKLKPAAAAAQDPVEVEKQKVAAEAAFEKRMLDHFIENGGTAESFVALKKIASTDLTELSKFEINKEMKEAKNAKGERLFSDEEIVVVLKERYYQINPEELVIGDNETEEDFEKRKALTEKKIAFGANKMAAKSSYRIEQAKQGLENLKEAIKLQDLHKAEELQNSKRVEEFFEKAPRKVTLELGKTKDGKDIAPVEFTIPETLIADTMGTLKDPEKRNKFFYNDDDSLNLDNLSKVVLENNYLKEALKEVFSAGGTRQVEAFEKIFPGRIAKEIGVGGNTGGSGQGRKGVLVSRGEPEVVRR